MLKETELYVFNNLKNQKVAIIIESHETIQSHEKELLSELCYNEVVKYARDNRKKWHIRYA